MKKASKSVKHSMKLETLSKDCAWLDLLQEDSFRFFPDKDEWRNRLRYSMMLWSENKSSLEIEQFCIEYKIPRRTLYFWRDKYPDIKDTLDNVKLTLASRRRIGALNKKYDKDVVYKDMHKLDPEYLEINKYWADLKKLESDDKPTTINVVVDPVPDKIKRKDE